jgi:polyisoprenyl-phosphate glycosyltransferase
MVTKIPQLTVVVPSYGYSHLAGELYDRLVSVLPQMSDTYRVLFVEDGGPHSDWPGLCRALRERPLASALRMERNVGQHACIALGVEQAADSWAVVMDADLQDPPELIAELYKKTQTGAELVLAIKTRTGQSLFRDFFGRIYHSILRGRWNPPRYSCFSLLSPSVVREYLKRNERRWLYIAVLEDLEFRVETIRYERCDSGRSTYNWRKLLKMALRNPGLALATRLGLWSAPPFRLSPCERLND